MLTLVVDDNKLFRQYMVEVLNEHFPVMRIAVAQDADEAWRQVQLYSPDLIFMDIHMPGCNGLELTRKIKDRYPGTVVIVLTSYDLPEYQEAARSNGASFFLTKGKTSQAEILSLVDGFALAHS